MVKLLSTFVAAIAVVPCLVGAIALPEAGVNPPDRRPLVDSKKLRRSIKISELQKHAEILEKLAFTKGKGNRAFGSPGHNASINYIYDTISKLDKYYDVWFQPFTERYSAATGTFSVDGEEQVFYAARASPSIKGLKAELGAAKGEGCNPGDFPTGLDGKIVLLSRGNCTITEKSQLAKAAGAAAVIVYNNVPGTVLDGRLLEVPDIVPTGAISNTAGLEFLKQLEQGETLVGELSIEGIIEDRLTYNVIAETKTGDKNNVIFLGAHSDSVPLGPGINDNGSGSIGLLEVLIRLKEFKTNNAIRFAWWSAEEYGLLGAAYYVKQLTPEENLKIAMYLNFDMIASPNYILGIYDGDGSAFNLTGPPGSDKIEYTFEDFFEEAGTGSVPTAFTGRSDYGPFLEVNIPSGGLFTGAEGIKTEAEAKLFGGEIGAPYDVNYHQPGDGVSNLSLQAFVVNTKAIAYAVAKYGVSTKGFPERTLPEGKIKRAIEWSVGPHGHNHDHSSGGCGDGLY